MQRPIARLDLDGCAERAAELCQLAGPLDFNIHTKTEQYVDVGVISFRDREEE
jgi:hypothetical protein